ncbi:tryptophan--tRNA ligase [Rickettsia prowazekii]|uniref:Tryptophan--tRNA ligase n=2 Tax=Rickettsia prowazekii TaxID=782 RepID=SYW_RICPR|nr:tryptophan--tRNA ligase [Rickettsia prowazekii]Q9ZD76.1 RecName: Full=Tryptophan--tRNA ligase; AltName: Full=Tryptophanyl-tRNA synthetase; Short=TrpRS [Rickettsia prowazekii str. Madrid E]EOB09836.1 Tryptophan--tRNA ligase [Rickettsia prowazekii str. GvF12]ADE29999.1 Tryptophanyl-tRNA synthetase [Rickettsia prowazekii str. Rp22]AFE49279.1 tryptophanyl-tRNA synthetase [Rickettsia prowazekii str. Chernikova]AFE50125.1 tryptophanyl-tRNA synthetase [Rickettsia prowazekii str. Katsinyian]AFE509
MKKTVLSGVQTTGALHLGNYLGSIRNWIKMQEEYNCFFFLADLHAITIDIKTSELNDAIMEVLAIYLAAGLNPDKVTIFAQSMVKEHVELSWLLNCVTPLGWLKRMTQFKDKAGSAQCKACLGLFAYPILMAADILIYKADIVPVGEDQKQHLELTRDIAEVINRRFDKEILKVPDILISETGTRIMSLRNGLKKMSKSDISDFSRINLKDSNDLIHQKIKKAKTDHLSFISYNKKTRPEISNLLDIYKSFSKESIEKIIDNYQNQGFAKFKEDLAEIIITNLQPIRNKCLELMNDKEYLLKILHKGAQKARIRASETVNEVKKQFGFII